VTRPLRPSLALPDVSEGHHAAARRAWRSPVERRLRGRRRSISEGIAIVCAPQKDERGVPAGSARLPRWRKTWMPRQDAWLISRRIPGTKTTVSRSRLQALPGVPHLRTTAAPCFSRCGIEPHGISLARSMRRSTPQGDDCGRDRPGCVPQRLVAPSPAPRRALQLSQEMNHP